MTEKTRLLFVTSDLGCDGASKSLISLLEQIDYTRYETDLLLFSQRGMFMEALPSHVNLLPELSPMSSLTMPIRRGIPQLIRQHQWNLVCLRILFVLKHKLSTRLARSIQSIWPAYSRYIPPMHTKYDVAISYQDYWPKYFLAEKVMADIKIAWNHCNFAKTGISVELERKYHNSLDHLVTISHACATVLVDMFPEKRTATRVVENIISPALIRSMAREFCAFDDRDFRGYRIVTVARLAIEKGVDIAVDACSKLVQAGWDVRWYVIGEGGELAKLEKRVKQRGLSGKFFFLGLMENPYPYISSCDIYVQPSRTEGKSIAVEEAKAAGVPIIVTNYATVHDQIIDNITGVIAEINPTSIAATIERLLANPAISKKLRQNLQSYSGNEIEVSKLYDLFPTHRNL